MTRGHFYTGTEPGVSKVIEEKMTRVIRRDTNSTVSVHRIETMSFSPLWQVEVYPSGRPVVWFHVRPYSSRQRIVQKVLLLL